MSPLSIRPLRGQDTAEAARIAATALDPWTEQGLTEELGSECSRLFGLWEGSDLRGFAVFQTVLDEASLLTFTVDETQRRRGFGEKLLLGCLKELYGQGFRYCFLEVRACNEPAIHLYKKLGFDETGLRRGFYRNPPDDALLMQLNPENFPHSEKQETVLC